MFQKRRHNSAGATSTTASSTKSQHPQDPPPALVEDSDSDDCQQKRETPYITKRQHGRRRSILESLRLFLLTRRCGGGGVSSGSSKGHSVLMGVVLVLLFFLIQHNNRHYRLSSWLLSTKAASASAMLMQEAGYAAKPTMVGYYFTDIPTSSFTGKIQRIQPPPNRRAWRDMLLLHHRHNHPRQVEAMSPHHREEIDEASEDYAEEKPDLTPDPDTCQPQYEWQEKSFPACNSVHEVAMMGDRLFLTPSSQNNNNHSNNNHHKHHHHHHSSHQLRRRRLLEKVVGSKPYLAPQYQVLAHGYWRDTWMMKRALGKAAGPTTAPTTTASMETVAFKTMRYHHDVTEIVLDKQRRDSLTSDRLTFSKQAIHMYAYCGTSALYEYAPGGDLYKFIEQYETSQDFLDAFSPQERYQLAMNVTSALADLHNTERPDARHFGNGNKHVRRYPATAIVHADFNANQFVAVAPPASTPSATLPHFKLGDFNLARFVYWNAKHNHPCMVEPDGSGGQFRAPEEYAREKGRTEKLDIYRYVYMMCL